MDSIASATIKRPHTNLPNLPVDPGHSDDDSLVDFNLIKEIISFDGSFTERLTEFAKELQIELEKTTTDTTVPDLTRELQVEFVCLILAYKAHSSSNEPTITLSNFYSLLLELEGNNAAKTPEIKEALTLFRQYNPEAFLEQGIEIYNKYMQSEIKLQVTEEFNQYEKLYEAAFNLKLHRHAINVQVLLSSGMSSRQIFLSYPECRKDKFVPEDQRGRNYLKNTFAIDGPQTLRNIQNDIIFINDAKEIVKNTRIRFDDLRKENKVKLDAAEAQWGEMTPAEREANRAQKTPFYIELTHLWQEKTNLGSATLIKYVADGMLVVDQARNLTQDQTKFLEMPAIQKSIDKFELSMEQALSLPVPGQPNNGLFKFINDEVFSLF